MPISEVVSEGNVGLMQAVKRFDPDKGFRLATYAMWWIKAAIQEYILRSWSLVKMGTTANQKKLFFNLRKAKGQISALDEGDLKPDQVASYRHQARRHAAGRRRHEPPARRRCLSERAACVRRARASGRIGSSTIRRARRPSWRTPRRGRIVWPPYVTRSTCSTPRERRIFEARRLAEDPMTLEDLSGEFGVSRERVRQIEVRAFEKIQDAVKRNLAVREAAQPALAG